MAYSYEYARPALTVDSLIFAKDSDGKMKVLLIQRQIYPFKGMWAFPGGFVEIEEELEDAAKRELEEETGLVRTQLTQLHTFGGVGRDPRGRTVSVAFYAFLDQIEPVKGNDDAHDAKWFELDSLPEMAFDHGDIMAYARKALSI